MLTDLFPGNTLFTLITSAAVLLMTQQLLTFPDRSREIYACDVVWGYFPLTEILQIISPLGSTSPKQGERQRFRRAKKVANKAEGVPGQSCDFLWACNGYVYYLREIIISVIIYLLNILLGLVSMHIKFDSSKLKKMV